MRYLSRLLMPLILLMFSGAPALAQSVGWTISETKGSVVVIDSRGERAASVGLAVTPGATVRTKAQSSAVLVRGREFVTLRQNAQIRIPEAVRDKSIIQIIQDYGSAMFNIGKKADPHFGVETPYLAAVVKGTTFIIAVGADGATLQVTEGAVEASTPDGGARELILPGAVAMVAAGDTMRLVIEGEGRKVIDSPARPASGPAAAASAPAPAPAASSAASGVEPAAAPARGENRVDSAVVSSPGDVRNYTGGFASGEVTVLAGVVVADNSARGQAPSFNTDGGNGNGNGNGNGIPPERPGNGNGNGNDPTPPADSPVPPDNVPGPPNNVPVPPDNVPGPPDNVPGPPDNVPGPPDNVPGPPDSVPGPPDGVPGPPVDVGPPADVGPPDDMPEPPAGDDDVGDDDGGNGTGDEGNGNDDGNDNGNDDGNGNGNGNGGDNGRGPGARTRFGVEVDLSARDLSIQP